MRVLIYKRTHKGDPDSNGVFGVNDCMGRVRALKYDAVLGVGGVGAEPVREGISSKITWIGIFPSLGRIHKRGPLVTFEHFLLFDENGPEFGAWAPSTAQRFYAGKVRYVIHNLEPTENEEINSIIKWAIKNGEKSKGARARSFKGYKVKCVSSSSQRKAARIC